MKEVSKTQFREIYFQYGREADGWGQVYWDKFFEHDKPVPMKYRVEEPATPDHNRMMIVSDFGAREYRLFFMTEESEDGFFAR